jgi:hypothetical protein
MVPLLKNQTSLLSRKGIAIPFVRRICKDGLDESLTIVIAHRRDAEGAEKKFLYKKPLRALRLCGEPYKNDRIP